VPLCLKSEHPYNLIKLKNTKINSHFDKPSLTSEKWTERLKNALLRDKKSKMPAYLHKWYRF
jgi:hypothetical protein